MSGVTATLIVSRDSDLDIQYRENVVYLDDQEIGNLKFGERVERQISPGEHVLKVSNRVRKQEARFSATAGETIRFQSANIGSGCYRFLAEMLQSGVPHVRLVRLP
jgi:hypothetical protein